MNIKGTIYKSTDYYLYIEFDFENELDKDSYYIKKYSKNDVFEISLKKFLSNYIIEEPLMDAMIDDVKNNYEELLK